MTHRIVNREGREGIECLVCGMTSWHPTDVAEKYCAANRYKREARGAEGGTSNGVQRGYRGGTRGTFQSFSTASRPRRMYCLIRSRAALFLPVGTNDLKRELNRWRDQNC
jgi:hypothetical protein